MNDIPVSLKRVWSRILGHPFSAKAAVLAVFAAFFLLRALFITAESPYSVCNYMSPWIDESAYMFTVRDLLLHDSVPQDPDESYYYILKNTPGYQMLQYAFCSVFGVGYGSIRMAGVLLNALSLLMFYLLLVRFAGKRAAFWAALLLSINYLGIIYGRMALTHSFAVSLFCICAYFWFRASEHPAWATAAGGIWCITYFTNQLAVVFIAVLGCWWLLAMKRGNWKKQLTVWLYFFGGVAAAGLLLLSLYFYDLSLKDVYEFLMYNFFRRQSDDKASLWALLQRLIEPSQMMFFARLPFLTLAAFTGILAGLSRVMHGPREKWGLAVPMAIWFAVHILFLALFGYRPIRYHFYLLPPMACLAGVVLADLWKGGAGIRRNGDVSWGFLGGVLFISWIAVHFIGSFWLRKAGMTGAAANAFAALAVTGIAYVVTYRYPVPPKAGRITVLLLVVASAWYNLGPYADWVKTRKYRTVESGRDMGMAVGKDACAGMLGSLCNAFGAASHIKEVSYGISFGDRRVTPEYSMTKLLTNAPVTHILMRRDKKQFHQSWKAAFPDMYAGKLLVGTYYYKTFAVDLFRVENPLREVAYELTPFERGRKLELSGKPEQAITAYRTHVASHPEHADAWYRLGMLESRKDLGAAVDCLRKAAALLPRSFIIKRNLGTLLYATGKRDDAISTWSRAAALYTGDKQLITNLRKFKAGIELRPRLYRGNPYL